MKFIALFLSASLSLNSQIVEASAARAVSPDIPAFSHQALSARLLEGFTSVEEQTTGAHLRRDLKGAARSHYERNRPWILATSATALTLGIATITKEWPTILMMLSAHGTFFSAAFFSGKISSRVDPYLYSRRNEYVKSELFRMRDLRKTDEDAALASLLQLVDYTNISHVSQYWIAYDLVWFGETGLALPLWRAAWQTNPTFRDVGYHLLEAYLRVNDLESAKSLFPKLHQPVTPYAHLQTAVFLSYTGDPEQADLLVDQISQQNIGWHHLLVSRAQIKMKLVEKAIVEGHWQVAEEQALTALHFLPDYLPALIFLGQFYLSRKENSKAFWALSQLDFRKSKDIGWRRSLAVLHSFYERYDLAIEILDLILCDHPNTVGVIGTKVEVLVKQKKLKNASDYLKHYAGQVEGHPILLRAAIRLALAEDDPFEADRLLSIAQDRYRRLPWVEKLAADLAEKYDGTYSYETDMDLFEESGDHKLGSNGIRILSTVPLVLLPTFLLESPNALARLVLWTGLLVFSAVSVRPKALIYFHRSA